MKENIDHLYTEPLSSVNVYRGMEFLETIGFILIATQYKCMVYFIELCMSTCFYSSHYHTQNTHTHTHTHMPNTVVADLAYNTLIIRERGGDTRLVSKVCICTNSSHHCSL